MVEWIDKTADKSGTPINRANLMAMQGFESVNIDISDDGKTIVETNAKGHTLTTTLNEDGSITETFSGEKIIVKTINFSDNGEIIEEVY